LRLVKAVFITYHKKIPVIDATEFTEDGGHVASCNIHSLHMAYNKHRSKAGNTVTGVEDNVFLA